MSVSAIEFGLRLVSRRFRAKHPASFHLMQIGLSIMVYCSLLKSLVVRLHQRPLSSARGGTVAGENHLQGIPRLFAWVVAASAGQCVEPRTKFFIPLRRLPRPIPRSGSGVGVYGFQSREQFQAVLMGQARMLARVQMCFGCSDQSCNCRNWNGGRSLVGGRENIRLAWIELALDAFDDPVAGRNVQPAFQRFDVKPMRASIDANLVNRCDDELANGVPVLLAAIQHRLDHARLLSPASRCTPRRTSRG